MSTGQARRGVPWSMEAAGVLALCPGAQVPSQDCEVLLSFPLPDLGFSSSVLLGSPNFHVPDAQQEPTFRDLPFLKMISSIDAPVKCLILAWPLLSGRGKEERLVLWGAPVPGFGGWAVSTKCHWVPWFLPLRSWRRETRAVRSCSPA